VLRSDDASFNVYSDHIQQCLRLLTVSTWLAMLAQVAEHSYHHGDLRAALIGEALAALSRDGELPSWRALARACKVSQSAPYRHFASADELRIAVVTEGFRGLEKAIRDAKDGQSDPFDSLAAGCRAYIRYGIRHAPLYQLMFRVDSEVMRGGEAAAAARGSYATLIEALTRIGVPDPERTAFTVWTAMHGLVSILHLGMRAPGMPDVHTMIDLELDMILRYVKGLRSVSRRKRR
jgi:AcrR family transcriptional regulator